MDCLRSTCFVVCGAALLALTASGCNDAANRNVVNTDTLPDLTLMFADVDLASSDDAGGGDNTNACGDNDQRCTKLGFGPTNEMRLVLD